MAVDVLHRMMATMSYNPLTGDFFWKDGFRRQTERPLGWLNPSGHRRIDFEGKKYYAHRMAMAFTQGEWPVGEVDHIDRDPANNRLSNLRVCGHAENVRNSPKRSHSNQPFKGVRPTRGGAWSARIRFEKREIYLGTFNTPELAFEAYKAGALKFHGQFARFE